MIPTLIDVPRYHAGTTLLSLLPTSGDWCSPENFSPFPVLFWNEEGLSLQVTVHDDVASEQSGKDNLWQGDSVEVFLGTKVGEAQYVQFLIAPGADPKTPGVRIVHADHRMKLRGPTHCQATSEKRTKGYYLAINIPWKQLGISPKPGLEVAFQLVVNDRDKDGTVRQFGLHPGGSAYNDPQKMVRLRLRHDSLSRTILLAAEADYSRFPQTRVTLTGMPSLVGSAFILHDKTGTLATGRMAKKNGRAVAEVMLTRAWDSSIACKITGQNSPLLLENPTDLRAKVLADAKLGFSKFVFTEEKLPTPELSPRIEAALGPYSLTTVFYDAAQKITTQPKAPGRYGALTTLKTKSGLTRQFFTTLYKSPGSHDAWEKPNFFAGRIPEELGVAPEISKQRQGEIAEFLRERFLAHLSDDPKSAVLLAGLAECKPEEPAVARLSADARNGRWWFSLQQKLGIAPRFRYATQLPAGYDTDKTKRWPLLLFLHGSGEAGDTLDLVRVHGPWKHAKEFVIVAPQNPVDDWWRPEQVLALVDELEKKYRLDATRLYLTGLSLGGYGTWATALLAPQRFAAIVPICGAGDPADATRLQKLPTWAFHGVKDGAVPVRHSQEMIAAMQKSGAREARLTLYPDTGHDCWNTTYANQALYAWLLFHRSGSL